jgi:hypothetical protein
VDTIGAQVHIDRMVAAAGDAGSRSGAALVEAGLGSSYTSEWSCEEQKTAEIRFSAKLSWERVVLTAVGQAWGQEVRQKAGRGRTALGAPWPEI